VSVLVLAAAASLSCGRPPSELQWVHSLDDARRTAAADHKVIVVDLFTDWCGWCKQMDQTTWGSAAVAAQSDKYVFLKLNAESDPDGIALQRRFAIESYPMILLLDSEGAEFDRLEGYLPAEQFLAKLERTLKSPDALGNLRDRANRESANLELRLRLGKRLFDRSAVEDASKEFERILAEDPSNKSRLADSALLYVAICQATAGRTDSALGTLDRLQSAYPDSTFVPNAFLLSGEILMRVGRRDAARARLEAFVHRFPDHKLAARAREMLSDL
jgi:thioredoxin-like negative regulator of GroEL